MVWGSIAAAQRSSGDCHTIFGAVGEDVDARTILPIYGFDDQLF